MSGPRSALRRVARAVTAPVRGYLNNHFEMVKHEVRTHAPVVEVDLALPWQRIAELENSLAESTIYQAQVLARLSGDVADLEGRIVELDRLVRQLAAVIAASTVGAAPTVDGGDRSVG